MAFRTFLPSPWSSLPVPVRAVELDSHFQDLEPSLKSESAHLVLEALARFAAIVGDRYDLASPYLEELAAELSVGYPDHPVAGIDPARLEPALRLLIEVQEGMGLALAEPIERLRRQIALLYAWAGAWDTVIRLVDMPRRPGTSDKILSDRPPAAVLSELASAAGDGPASDRLAALRRAVQEQSEGLRRGLVVPVVQRLPGDGAVEVGRLRRVTIELEPRRDLEHDRIYAAVALLDESEDGTFAADALNAARLLLEHRRLITKKDRYAGRIHLEESRAVHQGFSADLAIGILYYTATLATRETRTQIRLQPGVAVTGGLTSGGAVRPVDAATLPNKVEAVFFSPVRVLVVPESQRALAAAVLADLNQRYPRRRLDLIGVETLEEVFYDTRVAREDRIATTAFASRWLWKRKFTAGGIATIVALLLALIALIVFQIDGNPASGRYEGERLVLSNQYGRDLGSIHVGLNTVEVDAGAASRIDVRLFSLADVDGDGDNDLCFGVARAPGQPRSFVACRPTGSGFRPWSVEITKPLRYPGMPSGGTTAFFPRQLEVVPCETGSGRCLIVNAQHEMYFASLVLNLDPLTGEEIGHWVHNGTLMTMALTDTASGRYPMVVVGGTMQNTGDPVVGLLDPARLSGQSPSAGRYLAAGYEPGRERYYVRFPRTVVGEAARYLQPYRMADAVSLGDSTFYVSFWDAASPNVLSAVDQSLGSITTGLGDWRRVLSRIVASDTASVYAQRLDSLARAELVGPVQRLLAEFDYTMRPLRVWSGSEYDLMAEFLYDHGLIEAIPDSAYWEAYRGRIEYWNGDEWVTEPVENRWYEVRE